MDRLHQSLRIALALAAFVLVFLLVLPARPVLLAGPGATVIAAPARSPAPAGRPAEPAAALPPAAPEAVGPAPASVSSPGIGEAAPADAAADAEPSEQAAAQPDASELDLQLFRRPVAVSAGTLEVGERRIRIAGLEPLGPGAQCERPGGYWPCGAQARTAFRGWLRSRSVLCRVPPDFAEAAESVAPCLLGEEDVGEWIVANGWAEAVQGSRYEDAEAAARRRRLGIWEFGEARRRDGR